jgi:hypothetical protein
MRIRDKNHLASLEAVVTEHPILGQTTIN